MAEFQGPRVKATGSQDTALQLMMFKADEGKQVRGLQDSDAADLLFTNLKVLTQLYCDGGGLTIAGDDGDSAPTSVNIAATTNQSTTDIFQVQYEDTGLQDAFKIESDGRARFDRQVRIYGDLYVDGTMTTVNSEEVNIEDVSVIFGGGIQTSGANAPVGFIAKQVTGASSFTATDFANATGVITMSDNPTTQLAVGDLFFVHGSTSNDGLYEVGAITAASITIQAVPTVTDTFGVQTSLTDETGATAEVSESNAGALYYDNFRWKARRHGVGGTTTDALISASALEAFNQGQLRMYESGGDDSGGNLAAFRAAASMSSNTLYTLPAAFGSPGQFLQDTDGSGTLAWADASDIPDGTTTGEILYWNQTGTTWAVQSQGGDYEVLQPNTTTQIPTWGADLHIGDSGSIYVGTGQDLTVASDGANVTMTSTGNLDIDNTSATGQTYITLGTDTAATDFIVRNNSGTSILDIDGLGVVDFDVADSQVTAFTVSVSGKGNPVELDSSTDQLQLGAANNWTLQLFGDDTTGGGGIQIKPYTLAGATGGIGVSVSEQRTSALTAGNLYTMDVNALGVAGDSGGNIYGAQIQTDAVGSATRVAALLLDSDWASLIEAPMASGGTMSIKVGDSASDYSFAFPDNSPTNGYYLQTDDNGNTTWASVSGTVPSGTAEGQVLYWDQGGTQWLVNTGPSAQNQVLITGAASDYVPTWSNDLSLPGNLSVDGNTTLGDATSDTVTITGRLAADVDPNADGTIDLGAAGTTPLRFNRVHTELGGFTWVNSDDNTAIAAGAPVMVGNTDQVGAVLSTVANANKGAFIGFAVDGMVGAGTTGYGYVATSGPVTVSKANAESWAINDPLWLSPTSGEVTNDPQHASFSSGDFLIPCGYAGSSGTGTSGTCIVVVGGEASEIP